MQQPTGIILMHQFRNPGGYTEYFRFARKNVYRCGVLVVYWQIFYLATIFKTDSQNAII